VPCTNTSAGPEPLTSSERSGPESDRPGSRARARPARALTWRSDLPAGSCTTRRRCRYGSLECGMPIAATKWPGISARLRLDLFHALHQLLDVLREALSSSAMRAPVPAALPQMTPATVAVGNHPEDRRVLDVDMIAERTGEADPVDVIHAHMIISSLTPACSAALAS